MTPNETALRDALERLGAPVRIDAFNHIAAGEENYHAMLLSDEDPGCARILAQDMQDQTADDIAFIINDAFNRLQSPSQPVVAEYHPSLELCVQFSDDGQHIRKWSRLPFDGGECLYSHPQASPPPVQGESLRERIAEAISRKTFAIVVPTDTSDCADWSGMSERVRDVYRAAADEVLSALAHSQPDTQEGE